MYMDDYKRWLSADLEDAELNAELALIEGKEDEIIFAATEQRSPEEVEALEETIAAFCAEKGL